MQFQQQNLKTYFYPIYSNSKHKKEGFLQYNYLNSKYYKVKTNLSKDIYTNTSLKRKDFKIGDISLVHSDIVLFILLVLFVIVTFVKISSKNYIHRITNSLINNSYSDSFYNEKNISLKIYGYLLSFVFFVSYSLLITTSINVFFPKIIGVNWFLFFFIIFFFLISLYVLQIVTIFILGHSFHYIKLSNEHKFYVSNLIKFGGIVFIVLYFAIFFSDVNIKKYLIYLAVLLSFVLYFLKILRTIVSFLRNGFSLLYMFLYFCAFEIIPVLLLVKILLLLIELNRSFLNIAF